MKSIIPGDYQYRALTQGQVMQRFWHDNKISLLQLIGNFSSEDIVLDAGCGSGNISFYLAKKVSKVIGVDVNKRAVCFAESHARALKLKNVSFKTANLKKLPFKKNYFAKVILFEVIEHLSEVDYGKMITEIHHVMKPGGLLYLTTPNKLSSWPIIQWFLDTFKLVPALGKSQHILELTPLQAKKIIRENGFNLLKYGSLNHISPFFSLFSWRLGKKIFNFEVKHLQCLGPIIWLVAEKPDGSLS